MTFGPEPKPTDDEATDAADDAAVTGDAEATEGDQADQGDEAEGDAAE